MNNLVSYEFTSFCGHVCKAVCRLSIVENYSAREWKVIISENVGKVDFNPYNDNKLIFTRKMPTCSFIYINKDFSAVTLRSRGSH